MGDERAASLNSTVGVDGCKAGWLCVEQQQSQVTALVVGSFAKLLDRLSDTAIIAIDIPIGLTQQGPRGCDLAARQFLSAARKSSVFPAPVRSALQAKNYSNASDAHYAADGRRISKQTFAIMPKIKEVDDVMKKMPTLQNRIREVHPEVSFAEWNDGQSMQHHKSNQAGAQERLALIETTWPGLLPKLWEDLELYRCEPDDLKDAFAALWTAQRIRDGREQVLPASPEKDEFGLRMEIVA